jgi:hypothetical protein
MTTLFPKNNNDSKNPKKFQIVKRIQNSIAVYCICNLLVVIIITVSKLPLYTVIAGYYVMPTNTSLWGTHCHSNISPLHSFYNINDGQPLKSSSKQNRPSQRGNAMLFFFKHIDSHNTRDWHTVRFPWVPFNLKQWLAIVTGNCNWQYNILQLSSVYNTCFGCSSNDSREYGYQTGTCPT